MLTAIALLFKIQIRNLQAARVSLLSLSVTLQVSLLVIGIYLLGMFTGGFVVSLLRGWLARARRGG